MTHYPQHDWHSLSLSSSYRRVQILTGNHVSDLLWESPITRPETHTIKEVSIFSVTIKKWSRETESQSKGQAQQDRQTKTDTCSWVILLRGQESPWVEVPSLFPESCLPNRGARTLVSTLQKRILISPEFVTSYTSTQEKHSIPHGCNHKFKGHRGDTV